MHQQHAVKNTEPPVVAVVGGGKIGLAFAIVFASAGIAVRVFDVQSEQRQALPARLSAILEDLHSFDLLEEAPEAIAARVTVASELSEAVADAGYVQECIPESLSRKESLFSELDRLTPLDVVLASASSAMPVSEFASNLSGRQRCLVVHPGNPPFLLRVAEVVPATFTDAAVVVRARALLATAGLSTVLVRKEIKGFVFNRLQGAVLREAYCLVRDDVVSVEDVDLLVRDGLGLRWSVVGPFESVDLNTTGGIGRHAELLGPAYVEMGAERGQRDAWTPDLVAKVESQCRKRLPLSRWEQRTRWRDRALMALLTARRRLMS